MEKATEIFEKHWTKATGKPLDETTKHHMKFAIEAINEALLLGAVSGELCPRCNSPLIYKRQYTEGYSCNNCFHDWHNYR